MFRSSYFVDLIRAADQANQRLSFVTALNNNFFTVDLATKEIDRRRKKTSHESFRTAVTKCAIEC